MVKPEHRALQDAQATAELLVLFLSWLQEEGMTTLEEVARFCEPGARRNYHKISLTEGLPQSPGVYLMRDAGGQPLYIGKAENLRRRTRDHFLQRQAYHARQALELLERIEVVETGSEFGALLLEQRLIARHKPHYNSHGTRAASYHYVKLSGDELPAPLRDPQPARRRRRLRRALPQDLRPPGGSSSASPSVYPLRTCSRLPRGGAGGAGRRQGPARERRRAPASRPAAAR